MKVYCVFTFHIIDNINILQNVCATKEIAEKRVEELKSWVKWTPSSKWQYDIEEKEVEEI